MNKRTTLAAPVRVAVFTLLLSLVGLGVAPSALAQANANPPQRLAYQGFLADGNGDPLASTAPKNYDVIFRIWTAGSAGDRLWAEQQTVTVDKGNFSVLLGEGSALTTPLEPHDDLSTLFSSATASDRFVEMTVKGIGALGSDVTILPRLRLLTAPYAFLASRAVSAGSVDGAGVTSGTVPDARLSANVARLDTAQTYTAVPTFSTGLKFDSSIQSTGGNARGTGAVDLQTSRTLATQVASGSYATVGGGQNNVASGDYSTVPGGQNNVAAANSFAAGNRAKANHTGTFVWGDSTAADIASTGNNQFLIRASGGVAINKTPTYGVALDVQGNGTFGTIWVGTPTSSRVLVNSAGVQAYTASTPKELSLNASGGGVKVNNKYVPVGEENLRIVRGSVQLASNGSFYPTVAEGTGFSVTSLNLGVQNSITIGTFNRQGYRITFDPPFGGVPTVTANAWKNSTTTHGLTGQNDHWVVIETMSATTCDLSTHEDADNGSGPLSPSPFTFIAIGPR